MKDAKELKLMTTDDAVAQIQDNMILGIGTGSTIELLIPKIAERIQQDNLNVTGVCTSNKSEFLAKQYNINVVDINDITYINLAIDGADEIDRHMHMIKGGGAALTREKIVASIAKKFVCIVDDSKWVEQLGREFPLPVEVIPMARSAVARKIVALGGDPVYREGVVTDNGNVILDVYNLNILNAIELEKALNNIPGVVTNGIFALNAASIAIVATNNGIEERTAQ